MPKSLRRVRLGHVLYVLAFFGLLALPMLTHHWDSDPGVRAAENREPAPLPERPQSWHAVLAWPKQADAYLADHFGGRTAMVMAFNRARYDLFGETPTEQTVFGQHGRLFLTSHGTNHPYDLITFICGAGIHDDLLEKAASDLEGFLRQATSWAAESYLMAVPTAPTVYAEDLPSWIQAQCPAADTMDRLLPRLVPGPLRDHLIYSLPAMMAAKSRGEVIPLTNYHWAGLGPEAVAAAFAEDRLGLPRRVGFPIREDFGPSDIAHMVPGIPTGSAVRHPDFAGTGIDYCRGDACFPALGGVAGTIYDLSRLRSPQAGDKKLLILSDSFGAGIVPWFAPYFGTIWHFSVSNLGRLSPDERGRFRQYVFGEYRPDVVLYLFQDGSVHYWPQLAGQGIWGP